MEDIFVTSPQEIKSTPDNDFLNTLDQCIKQIIKNEGFINCELNKRCITLDGNNFLSNLYEIDLRGRTQEGDKELNIFVKHITQIEMFVIISVPDLYKSELFVYKELSKIFTTLQNEVNVPLENRFKMAQIYEESNSEVIIMENLAKKGFTTCFRMDVMSLEFAKRSIEQLARFHALSFVLRERRPEYFETKIKSIKHPQTFNDQWEELIKSSKETALDNVDEEFKDKLEEAFKDFMDKYPKYCNDETVKACLCHGDYKLNNIMVKIDKEEIQDVVPIDFQHIHYGCPIFDLLFFIYVGSDRDFRQAHMLNLKNHYYETLNNFLKYFDLDADKIYPRDDFEKIYKEKLDYGAVSMMVFLPFFFVAQNYAPDIKKRQSNISIKVDDRYKDRLMGLIEDYTEMNCI